MIMRLDLVGVVVLGVSIILSALLVVTVSSINPLQLSHITYRSSESEFVSSYDSSNDQQSTPSSSSSSSSSSEYYQYKNESSSFGDRFLRFVKRMFWFVPSTSFNNDEDDSEYYSGYLSYDDDDNGDDEDEDDIQSTPEAMRSEIQSSRNYYHRRFARRDLERSSLMDSNISSEFLAETQTFFGQATSSSGSGAGVDSYFMTSSGGSGTGASSHTSSVVAAAAAAAASSSYNVSSIVIRLLIGFLLYSITIWTIIGNIIVCVIVLTNRQLKQGGMSNFLIGNLALSDLLLGLTVLPFSATLSTFKTWLFGKILCDLWLSIDVLCSTASIWALLVISLDRYIATNHPIRYRKQKNSIKIAIIYCTVSWLISIMISLGPLFFISSDEETAVRTTTQTSPLSPISQPPSNAHSSPYSISFSNHSGASFVSSSSSINGVKPGNGNGGNGGSGGGGGNGGHVHTSKKSGLRQIENSTDYECVLFQTPSFVILSSLGSFYLPLLMMIGLYTGVFLKIRQQSKMKFKKKTKDRRRKDITSPNKGKGQQHNNSSSPTTKHHHNNNSQQTTANVNETTLQSPPPHKKSSSAASENNNNVNTNTNNNNNTAMSISSKQGGATTTTTTAAATSKGRGSIKSIGSGSVRRSPPTPRPLVPAGGGVVRRVSQLKRPTTTAHHQLSSSEARITKTLGIIMGVFVVCWLPFFLIYNVRSQLADPDSISGNTMEFFLWLGYFNSALNPILYAILNANFRNAFRDILACRCCLPGVSHSSLNRTLSRISSVNYTTTNSSIYYSNTNHKNAPKTTTTTSSGGGGGGENSIDNSTRKMTTTTT